MRERVPVPTCNECRAIFDRERSTCLLCGAEDSVFTEIYDLGERSSCVKDAIEITVNGKPATIGFDPSNGPPSASREELASLAGYAPGEDVVIEWFDDICLDWEEAGDALGLYHGDKVRVYRQLAGGAES